MARVVAVGVPHLVTQRSYENQDVFTSDSLRLNYLYLLREHAAAQRLRVLAYCLMPNQVQAVVIPEQAASLAKTFRQVHARFSQYRNTETHKTGPVWQSRFGSCPVDDSVLNEVLVSVENHPVRIGLVRHASQFIWSSARAHLDVADESGLLEQGLFTDLLDMTWWRTRFTTEAWNGCLESDITDEALNEIRVSARAGRPYGQSDFVKGLEMSVGRRLTRGKPGRPRKRPALQLPQPEFGHAAGAA